MYIKIGNQKFEVEERGFITVPYYLYSGQEGIEGIAFIPMVSKKQFPYSVFEFLESKRKENEDYIPIKSDLERFPYVLFPDLEEITEGAVRETEKELIKRIMN